MKMDFNLPIIVDEFLNKLNTKYESFLVGGCVRDMILGRQPHDWDFTTEATPRQIMNMFENVIPTGIAFGTVTVLFKGEEFEVTTFRKDGTYTDGRRPNNITFGKSITDDLSRRDLTINAIALDNEKNIIDPFNGINDIKNKIIRCVGNPNERFQEDALRMMRAIRFSAVLGFNISDDVIDALKNNSHLIINVSNERIRDEFNKILIDPEKIKLLADVGLLKIILPEINNMINFEQNNQNHCFDLFKHTIESMKNVPTNNIILKWTMLLHDVGKINTKVTDENGIDHFFGHPQESVIISKKILKRFKMENKIINEILPLINFHESINDNISKKMIRKLISQNINIENLIIIRKADILAQSEFNKEIKLSNVNKFISLYEEIKNEESFFNIKDLVINGNDIMKIKNIKQGKEIGIILNEIFNIVLENPEKNKKEILIPIIEKIIVN